MHIDRGRCAGTGLCELLAPSVATDPDDIPVTRESLEAMAACPTGALSWSEVTEPGDTRGTE